MSLDKIAVCLSENAVTYRGGRVELTLYEAELLYVLARHAPETVRHDHLRAALWGAQDGPADEARTLTVYIGRLRRKLRPLGLTITLSKKVGYFLSAGQDDACPPPHQKPVWTEELIGAFLAMCRNGAPREHIADRLGLTGRQIRSLHDFLRRHGRQPYPFPPKMVDLRRANYKRPCQADV